jgi:hypothetical protein
LNVCAEIKINGHKNPIKVGIKINNFLLKSFRAGKVMKDAVYGVNTGLEQPVYIPACPEGVI